MQAYRNLSGKSGIVQYETGVDWIEVVFDSGQFRVYRYTIGSAGIIHIERLKHLARQGHGLNSYINTHVRERYSTRR